MKKGITNDRFKNINGFIQDNLKACKEFSIATAFIDEFTIEILSKYLQSNKQLELGKLLIGVFGSLNKKEHLKSLINLCQKYPSKFQVHISTNKKFHWKFFSFKNNGKLKQYIGSANFTKGGLITNDELIYESNDNEILQIFNHAWNTSSKSINEFPLEHYEHVKQIINKEKLFNKILQQFFDNETNSQHELEIPSVVSQSNLVVSYKGATMTAKEEKIVIGQNSGWANKDFYGGANKSEYESTLIDSLTVFIEKNKEGQTILLAKVIGKDYIKGLGYYIAYKVKSRKKLTEKLRKELFEIGIKINASRNNFTFKKLRSKKALQVLDLF